METHIYKHHWRHGHHHHKDKTFFGLMAMLFFSLITLGVVASIYYSLAGMEKHAQASKQWETYKSVDGYTIKYPSYMKVDDSMLGEVAVGYPDQKWTFAVTTQPNSNNQTLDQVTFDVKTDMAAAGGSDSTAKVSAIRLGGVSARRVSISNFEDVGETVLIALKNGKIYLMRGSTGQSFNTADNDLLNFASQFAFTN